MDWALRGRIQRGGEGKEECNLFRWWGGGVKTWVRQKGCSGRCKCQAGEEKEGHAWLCDSSYIKHSVCVCWHWLLYLAEEQTLPIGTVRSFLFPPCTPQRPSEVHALFLPPKPSLICYLNTFSVFPSPVSTQHNCCTFLLPLSVSVEFSYALFAWIR